MRRQPRTTTLGLLLVLLTAVIGVGRAFLFRPPPQSPTATTAAQARRRGVLPPSTTASVIRRTAVAAAAATTAADRGPYANAIDHRPLPPAIASIHLTHGVQGTLGLCPS